MASLNLTAYRAQYSFVMFPQLTCLFPVRLAQMNASSSVSRNYRNSGNNNIKNMHESSKTKVLIKGAIITVDRST